MKFWLHYPFWCTFEQTGQHPLRRASVLELVAAGAAPEAAVGGGGGAREGAGAGGIGVETPRHGETGSPVPPGITMETLRSVTSRTISLKVCSTVVAALLLAEPDPNFLYKMRITAISQRMTSNEGNSMYACMHVCMSVYV